MEAKIKKSHIVLEEDLTIDYDSVIGGHETLKTIGILLTPKVFKEYLDAIEGIDEKIILLKDAISTIEVNFDYETIVTGENQDYTGDADRAIRAYNVLMRYYEKQKELGSPMVITQSQQKELPPELNTDKAKALLQTAIDDGLLNADYSPTDKTRTKAQKALLSEIISEKAGIKNKWKPFENLWNVTLLAQQRYESTEKIGKVQGGDIIEAAFK